MAKQIGLDLDAMCREIVEALVSRCEARDSVTLERTYNGEFSLLDNLGHSHIGYASDKACFIIRLHRALTKNP